MAGYHGYRYLVDAKNSREYAIRYVNGEPNKPLHVFAEDSREDGFKPNEVIFAMDDENELVDKGNGIFLSTTAYQITVPAHANPKEPGWNVKYIDVEYEVSFRSGQNNAAVVRYELTAESKAKMDAKGFKPGFPASYEEEVDPNARIDLSGLSFPPHHHGNAFIARGALEMESFNLPQPQEDTNYPSPAKDFNNKNRDVTPNKVSYKVSDSAIKALLENRMYCEDLSLEAANGKLDPVIGRDKETDAALKVMMRRKQSGLCFVGEAGAGKTAMFSAIAQRLQNDKSLPKSLQNARVVELKLQGMNAGAKFRGQFEEKLIPLMEGLKERGGIFQGRKIIFAIDELHSALTAGKAEGGTDSGNLLKPYMSGNSELGWMGTTTLDEYKKHIEKDAALTRRFEAVPVRPTNEEQTNAIIEKLMPLAQKHNNLTQSLTKEEMRYIVTMSDRYAPQEAQPSKAEKVLYTAAASAEFEGRPKIERKDILTAIAQMSKLPIDFLDQSDHERFLKLETDLPNEVLGQPELQRVVDGLIGARSGLQDPNQPWGCFVFQGPTGTGKTEAAKALARHLFGTEDALIKLDMSEYSEKHTVSRLIGAPPGFVGFEDAEPALTEKIRQRPYSILLLDEIEKAHPDVYNTLLPILNDGKMTDNKGKTVLFNNVIVIMTTNAGAAAAMALIERKADMSLGGGQGKSEEVLQEELKKVYASSRTLKGGGPFRPEMINRIEELGGFVTFYPLTQDIVSNLVAREIKKAGARLNSDAGANVKNVELNVSDEVKAQLAKEGYNPAMGARPLRKVVREKIINPLGKWLMSNKEQIAGFVAANGATKLLVDSIDNFEPKLVKADVAPVNDNQKAVAPKRKNAGPTP